MMVVDTETTDLKGCDLTMTTKLTPRSTAGTGRCFYFSGGLALSVSTTALQIRNGDALSLSRVVGAG